MIKYTFAKHTHRVPKIQTRPMQSALLATLSSPSMVASAVIPVLPNKVAKGTVQCIVVGTWLPFTNARKCADRRASIMEAVRLNARNVMQRLMRCCGVTKMDPCVHDLAMPRDITKWCKHSICFCETGQFQTLSKQSFRVTCMPWTAHSPDPHHHLQWLLFW